MPCGCTAGLIASGTLLIVAVASCSSCESVWPLSAGCARDCRICMGCLFYEGTHSHEYYEPVFTYEMRHGSMVAEVHSIDTHFAIFMQQVHLLHVSGIITSEP